MKVHVLSLILISTLSLISTKSSAGGTVVGNGGDPMFEFLEAARVSMIETLVIIATDPKESAAFCKVTVPVDGTMEFCHDYFLKVLPDMLRLSQGENRTQFVLRADPLEVEGPDGKPMIVTARTELGPDGVIEINRDAVKTLAPTQVLFLLAHEFQHKSSFDGKYLSDNEKVGPFSNGRELIDLVARSVVEVAKRLSKIGTTFRINDQFTCITDADGVKFGTNMLSSRTFLNSDLTKYTTTYGVNPNEGGVWLPETQNTQIVLKIRISEPNNCSAEDSSRTTSTQVVRRTTNKNSVQDIVLADSNSSVNPMCPNSDKRIQISWQHLNFNCEYFGSSGNASPLRGRNLYRTQLRRF